MPSFNLDDGRLYFGAGEAARTARADDPGHAAASGAVGEGAEAEAPKSAKADEAGAVASEGAKASKSK